MPWRLMATAPRFGPDLLLCGKPAWGGHKPYCVVAHWSDRWGYEAWCLSDPPFLAVDMVPERWDYVPICHGALDEPEERWGTLPQEEQRR